jgi:hypothetical protein
MIDPETGEPIIDENTGEVKQHTVFLQFYDYRPHDYIKIKGKGVDASQIMPSWMRNEMREEAKKWEAKGYKVKMSPNRMPDESVFLDVAGTAGTEQLVNATLDRMGRNAADAEERAPAQNLTLADFNYTTERTTTKDGIPELVLYGNKRKGLTAAFRDALGGQFYPANKDAGTKAGWHFKNPTKDFEQQIADKIALQLYGDAKTASDAVLHQRFDREMTHNFGQALADSLVSLFKGRGSRSSEIRRLEAVGPEVTQGYETDPVQAIVRAGNSTAGGLAKREMLQGMFSALSGRDQSWTQYLAANMDPDIDEDTPEYGKARRKLWKAYKEEVASKRIDSATMKAEYSEATDYIKDMARNETSVERIVSFIKGGTAIYMLSRIQSAVVNYSNIWMVAPATMSHFAGIPKRSAFRYLNRAQVAYVKGWTKNSVPSDPEVAWVMKEIRSRGYDVAQINKEAAQTTLGPLRQAYQGIVKAHLFLFGMVEQVNRASTIGGTYLALKDKYTGTWDEAARNETLAKALEVSNLTHGVYKKANLPQWARGGSVGRVILRSAYMFQTYIHNLLTVISKITLSGAKNLGKGRFKEAIKDGTDLLYMLLGMTLFGGTEAVFGSKLARLILRKIEWLTNLGRTQEIRNSEGEVRTVPRQVHENPVEAFNQWAEGFGQRTGGDTGEYIGRYLSRAGVAGLAGIDVSASLKLMPDIPWITKPIKDAGDIMAPSSWIAQLVDAAISAGKGDYLGAAQQSVPNAWSGVPRAIKEAKYGVRDKTGEIVYAPERPDKPLEKGEKPELKQLMPTAYDTALRAASFTPAHLSVESRKKWAVKEIGLSYDARKQSVYTAVKEWMRTHSKEEVEMSELPEGIRNRIDALNTRIEAEGLNMPLITQTSLRGIKTRIFEPTKQERGLSGEWQKAPNTDISGHPLSPPTRRSGLGSRLR